MNLKLVLNGWHLLRFYNAVDLIGDIFYYHIMYFSFGFNIHHHLQPTLLVPGGFLMVFEM